MRRSLLRMLVTLMCAMAACANVIPVADFDLQRMAGKWFISAMATNSEWFVNHKAEMRMGTAVLTPTAEGNLDLSYAVLNADGTCWRQKDLAMKSDTAGRFTFTSATWNNENDIRYTEVQYDNYALVYTVKTKDGVSVVLTELYKRNKEAVSDELQQKFKQFSGDNGVLSDNIVFLPLTDECPDA